MKKSLLIGSIGLSALALIVFIIGGLLTLNNGLGKQVEAGKSKPAAGDDRSSATSANSTSTTPTSATSTYSAGEQADSNTIRITTLGDSLARGYGDEEGGGFAGAVAAGLQTAAPAKKIQLNNVAVDGYKIADLNAQLKQPDVLAKVKAADVLLLSIGGNDLYQSGRTLLNLDMREIEQIRNDFREQYRTALANIRELNPNAPLYMIGLYNPFSELSNAAQTNPIIRAWNELVGELLATDQKATFVPTFDFYQYDPQALLHTDQFHPNRQGYQKMAERILSTLPAALASAERSTVADIKTESGTRETEVRP